MISPTGYQFCKRAVFEIADLYSRTWISHPYFYAISMCTKFIFHFLSIKKSPHLESGWASVGVSYLATADPTFTLHLNFFNLSFIKICDSVASFFSSGDACLALKSKPQPLMWGFFFLVLVIQCYFFARGKKSMKFVDVLNVVCYGLKVSFSPASL